MLFSICKEPNWCNISDLCLLQDINKSGEKKLDMLTVFTSQLAELREEREILLNVTQQNMFLKKVRNINFTPFNKGSLALIFTENEISENDYKITLYKYKNYKE